MIIKFPNNITNTNKDTNTSNKVFNDKEAIFDFIRKENK